MIKKSMNPLLWNNLYWLIERSYQMNLCCQRYVDKKRKLKRKIDWILVLIPGIGSLLYIWEPIATLIASGLTAVLALFNNIVPLLVQQESELKELDNMAIKFAIIRTDAEELVIHYQDDKNFSENNVRESYTPLQKQLEELEIQSNSLLRKISSKENEYLELETKRYLQKFHNG